MPRLPKAVPAAGRQREFEFGPEDPATAPFPERVAVYPELRYMGSKYRLLPWIHGILRTLPFETAADPFVGSGCVAYLL
jgi:adenine-specific DNA-methyltransferase